MNEYSSASDEEQDDVYSENEYSDHNSYLMRAVVAVTTSRRNRRRQPQPMHNSTLTGACVGDPILKEYVADCVPVRGNIDVNADYESYDGIDGTDPSTGTQQHDSSREAMNQMRDHIVDDMWERY
ncbi:hypothetical protein TIFTF001_016893 [Ficus carica]|uniref:Uncharacterized protein n=1 Tax=Ficus carica TaxID=3494 RepID=A0AA88A9J6_FICCA|nr:hypothetical protein TIFTF001_016893 [Ficus carica]